MPVFPQPRWLSVYLPDSAKRHWQLLRAFYFAVIFGQAH